LDASGQRYVVDAKGFAAKIAYASSSVTSVMIAAEIRRRVAWSPIRVVWIGLVVCVGSRRERTRVVVI
jgi:hypothetical protein